MDMSLDTEQILKDMVQIDTTNPGGNEKLVTNYIGNLLKQHGLNFDIIETEPGRANIVSAIGTPSKKPPIVFISHLDVVPAKKNEWTYPPFAAEKVDGYIYGRGTLDTKFLTATSLVTFITLSQETLNREIYFIATADEEKGSRLGMPHVVEKYQSQLTNAYVINEGGGFYIENGDTPYYLVTAGEKGRCDISVKFNEKKSPIWIREEEDAFDCLNILLERLANYQPPHEDNEVYRRFSRAIQEEKQNHFIQEFDSYNCQNKIILQNYEVGQSTNDDEESMTFRFALQLLPSQTQADAEAILENILGNLNVTYTITDFLQGFQSHCDDDFFNEMERVVQTYFCEKAKLVPVYALGRTDGRFLGQLPCQVFGYSLVTKRIPFEKVINLVHNIDERIDCDSLTKGVQAYIDLCKTIGVEDGK